MPIPKYVKKSKHKEYRKKHKEIVAALQKNDVRSPYAVATTRLRSQYEQKSGKRKSRKKVR